MKTKLTLLQLIELLKLYNKEINSRYSELNELQFNWRAANDSWSIAETIEHLNQTSRLYLPSIKEQLRTYDNINPGIPVLSKILGKLFKKLSGPENKISLKAPKYFKPKHSHYEKIIIEIFSDYQKELIKIIKNTNTEKSLTKTIYSPAIKIVTFSLVDCFELLVGHQKRHLNQMERIFNSENFPSQ